jgi:hypothetical protein
MAFNMFIFTSPYTFSSTIKTLHFVFLNLEAFIVSAPSPTFAYLDLFNADLFISLLAEFNGSS